MQYIIIIIINKKLEWGNSLERHSGSAYLYFIT